MEIDQKFIKYLTKPYYENIENIIFFYFLLYIIRALYDKSTLSLTKVQNYIK